MEGCLGVDGRSAVGDGWWGGGVPPPTYLSTFSKPLSTSSITVGKGVGAKWSMLRRHPSLPGAACRVVRCSRVPAADSAHLSKSAAARNLSKVWAGSDWAEVEEAVIAPELNTVSTRPSAAPWAPGRRRSSAHRARARTDPSGGRVTATRTGAARRAIDAFCITQTGKAK